MNRVLKFTSHQEFISELCSEIVYQIQQKDGVFRLAVSGGSTPGPLYSQLAEAHVDWTQVEIYLVDERYVPADSGYSNFKLIEDTLINKLPQKPHKWVNFDCSLPIEEALKKYEQKLDTSDPHFFDLILLGIGTDGHTASLFPDDQLLDEEVMWVGHSSNGNPIPDRLTLTYPALEASRKIIFLVSGEGKDAILKELKDQDSSLPAARLISKQNSYIYKA